MYLLCVRALVCARQGSQHVERSGSNNSLRLWVVIIGSLKTPGSEATTLAMIKKKNHLESLSTVGGFGKRCDLGPVTSPLWALPRVDCNSAPHGCMVLLGFCMNEQ